MNLPLDALKVTLTIIVVLLGVIGTLVAVLVTKSERAGRSATWTAGAGSFVGVVTVTVTLFNSIGLF
jgi:uncharacterized membrane protein